MEQLLLVNPRKRGKRRTPKRGAGGRFVKRAAKTTARRTRRRRNPAPALAAANPVRRYRRRKAARVVSRRRRRNPISARGFIGQLTAPLMPAIAGAGGALTLDAAFKFIPLPATLKTGYAGVAARAVTAVGIGMLLSRVLGSKLAGNMTQGALTVLAYNTIKPVAAAAAPNLLGYYGAGAVLNDMPSSLNGVGEYLSGPVPDSLNEYLSAADYADSTTDF